LAGSGLGPSIAKVFGRNGFSVALLARGQHKLNGPATQLSDIGIDAAGFVADVVDWPSRAAAFARTKDWFCGLDVLEYSAAPHNPVPGITMGTTAESY
jgi:NADP-dependent 3-hydroxy acid dehydrogenase YdfG